MNAEQLIKKAILQRAAEMDGREVLVYNEGYQVDEDWDNCAWGILFKMLCMNFGRVT